MSIIFERYEKIAESPRQWRLDEADTRALSRVDWVVTEKIHGAHFCIVCDEEICFARRKSLIPEGENFFGHLSIAENLSKKGLALRQHLLKQYPEALRFTIHGELFGGEYPHPDIEPLEGFQAIQTGVYYTPEVVFCAFDVALQFADTTRRYLDHDEAYSALLDAGFFCAEPLFIGSLSRALAFNTHFQTTIPTRLGLPPLPESNWAEGVVIKPRCSITVKTPQGIRRPILKHKHTRFEEDLRYHQAEAWSAPLKGEEFSNAITLLKFEAYNRVNLNRLANASSKIGWIKQEGRCRRHERIDRSRRLFINIVEDVLESLSLDEPEQILALQVHEKKVLRRFIWEQTQKLMKETYAKK